MVSQLWRISVEQLRNGRYFTEDLIVVVHGVEQSTAARKQRTD
jgi:hypothetical protein